MGGSETPRHRSGQETRRRDKLELREAIHCGVVPAGMQRERERERLEGREVEREKASG